MGLDVSGSLPDVPGTHNRSEEGHYDTLSFSLRVPSFLADGLSGADSLHGNASASHAGVGTPEEINNVRVYKQLAKSTVLVVSAYLSPHHIAQASGSGTRRKRVSLENRQYKG